MGTAVSISECVAELVSKRDEEVNFWTKSQGIAGPVLRYTSRELDVTGMGGTFT